MMIRISISFPEELYEELKEIASESERSLSRQVVWMLTNMVVRRNKLNVMVLSEDKEDEDVCKQ